MNLMPLDEKVEMTARYLQQAGLRLESEKFRAILQAAADRIKVAGDILDHSHFCLPAERLVYDEAAFDKRLKKPPEAQSLLQKFRDRLQSLEPFDAPAI